MKIKDVAETLVLRIWALTRRDFFIVFGSLQQITEEVKLFPKVIAKNETFRKKSEIEKYERKHMPFNVHILP